jgi:hypothetical protein
MRENVVFCISFQRTGGWCEPATIGIQKSLLNSKAEHIRFETVEKASDARSSEACATLLSMRRNCDCCQQVVLASPRTTGTQASKRSRDCATLGALAP